MTETLRRLESVPVGRYQIAILRSVRRDALPTNLEGPTLYLASYPTASIVAERGLEPPMNAALNRKDGVAALLPSPCTILSVVRERVGRWRVHEEVEEGPERVHVRCVSGRGADLVNTLLLTREVVARRQEYRTLVFYNFYFYQTLPAWVARRVLGKTVLVDYEDDYTHRSGHWGSKLSFRVLAPVVDGAVAIADGMASKFGSRPVAVVNSFADLGYVERTLDREHGTLHLLYAGSLDDIRGGDLLEPLTRALTAAGISHHIHVTGKGPLAGPVRALAERVDAVTYHGFVSREELEGLMGSVHAGLVLQKPDHPFSAGSFPSKVDEYAARSLPVLTLEQRDA